MFPHTNLKARFKTSQYCSFYCCTLSTVFRKVTPGHSSSSNQGTESFVSDLGTTHTWPLHLGCRQQHSPLSGCQVRNLLAAASSTAALLPSRSIEKFNSKLAGRRSEIFESLNVYHRLSGLASAQTAKCQLISLPLPQRLVSPMSRLSPESCPHICFHPVLPQQGCPSLVTSCFSRPQRLRMPCHPGISSLLGVVDSASPVSWASRDHSSRGALGNPSYRTPEVCTIVPC